MELSEYETWVNAREQHRRFLFAETPPAVVALGDVTIGSLTALTAAAGNTNNKPTAAELVAKEQLTEATHRILGHHNDMAMGGQSALFGISKAEDLEYVANLTAGVITRWDRACRRQGPDSPFAKLVETKIEDADFTRLDVQLVIETASAILEMLQLGYPAPRDPHSGRHEHFVNLVARQGRYFASGWLNGDIIRSRCEVLGIDTEGILDGITPGRLRDFAISNPRDPVGAVLRYADNVTKILSPENLALELGWDPQRVAAIFNPHTRKEIARRWANDPLAAAQRVAATLETTLATPNLAALLGQDPDFVDALFRPADRVRIALSRDPGATARQMLANFTGLTSESIASQLGWSTDKTDLLFTYGFRRKLAVTSGNLRARIHRIAKIFDEQLSVSAIAKQLGWDEERANSLFSPSARQYIAFSNAVSAPAKIQEIASTQAKLLQDFQLPIEIINTLSVTRTHKRAHAVAQKIQEEATNHPAHISPTIWMWTIASNPDANRETWIQSAAAYYNYLQVVHPQRPGQDLEGLLGNKKTHEAPDFLEDLFLDEPGAHLQDLAAKAGVTYAELKEVLRHFAESGTSPNVHVLQKLRGAARPTK